MILFYFNRAIYYSVQRCLQEGEKIEIPICYCTSYVDTNHYTIGLKMPELSYFEEKSIFSSF
jgi:hypothetical protein